MTKLPAISPKKLINMLEKSGFAVSRVSGSHVILNRPMDKRRVVVPCHAKDLPKGTLMSILHEAGIGKDRLKELF
jgi:Predicted periplasmic or secreted lipoprotein